MTLNTQSTRYSLRTSSLSYSSRAPYYQIILIIKLSFIIKEIFWTQYGSSLNSEKVLRLNDGLSIVYSNKSRILSGLRFYYRKPNNGILEITFNRNYIIQFHLKSNYPCFSRANFHNSKHFTSVADSHIPLVLPSTDIRRSMKPL